MKGVIWLNALLLSMTIEGASHFEKNSAGQQEYDLNPVAPHEWLPLHVKVEPIGYLYNAESV